MEKDGGISEQLAQAIVRQRLDAVIVPPHHGLLSTSALTIASSVASTTAAKIGSSLSLGTVCTV